MVRDMGGPVVTTPFGCSLAAIALAMALTGPAAAQTVSPVVVELYTSQGCNSCPPADRYLGELAGQPGIVALSFHVDYWNYLGWRDPFSSPKFTYRQKEYAMSFRRSGVYTPQMVIQGRSEEVGSDRRSVARAIAEARKLKLPATVALDALGGNRIRATITAPADAKGADIWLALFDRKQTTAILRGENEGKTLTYHHVVRDWRKLGSVDRETIELQLTVTGEKGEKRDGAAVLLQRPHAGAILGAAIIYTD
jgi:hypothetical protein